MTKIPDNSNAPTVTIELTPVPKVAEAFEAVSRQPGCLLLDSSMQITAANRAPLGRYSFLMADPFKWVVKPIGASDPLAAVRQSLKTHRCDTIEGLPPMQGGWAGLLSYDLNRSFESLPAPKFDEFQLPVAALGCYDVVLAWDHDQDRAWIISQGFPAVDAEHRHTKAKQRAAEFQRWLRLDADRATTAGEQLNPAIPAGQLAPQHTTHGPDGLTSNFSREQYIAAVERSIEYIRAGDVFQVNLAQRLLHPANCRSVELYQRLRSCNPATFAGYFDFPMSGASAESPTAQIVSASPERFVSVRDGVVETRPIKGTRRRTGTPMVDIHSRGQLLASEKDRAENTMIVDLMRNDLSRVCDDASIRVTQLCQLEEYQSVLHLVSAVEGQLKPDANPVDLIEAIFPGGSITGAPKVRAMEIVAELEPTARGAYCGSLGYIGFNGNADLSILIRSITAAHGWWQIPVGGGIVIQSDPAQEYNETWTKAAGMLAALNPNPT